MRAAGRLVAQHPVHLHVLGAGLAQALQPLPQTGGALVQQHEQDAHVVHGFIPHRQGGFRFRWRSRHCGPGH